MADSTANQKNLEFFEKRLPDLLNDVAYKGKFVVVYAAEIRGTYDNFDAALNFAVANYLPNEFLIQQVLDESERINFLRAAIG